MHYHASADRIQFDVAECQPEAILIQGARKEAVLPQMASEVPLDMLPPGVVVVQSADSAGKGISSFRNDDLMGVIGHERVSSACYLILEEVLSLEYEIEFPLGIRLEDRPAMIAPLGDVVRAAWNDNSGKSRHRR